jgi:alpha-N-arabinofuranosidase
MQAGVTAYAIPLNHYDVLVEKKDGNLVVRPNIRLGELAYSAKEKKLKDNKALV